MKMICRLSFWAPALALSFIAVSGEVSASQVTRQMTFEEVATQATVIVLGRVTKIPEMASYDPASPPPRVYRRNVVHVEEYLKGTGPTPDIEVVTFGGNFLADKGPREQSALYIGEPQLPPVGTEVLLFLTPFAGSEAFIIYTAGYGISRVQEGEKGQERFVSLLISNPDLLSTAGAARLREMGPSAPGGPIPAVAEHVPVSTLKATVEKALHLKRKPPEAGTSPKTP